MSGGGEGRKEDEVRRRLIEFKKSRGYTPNRLTTELKRAMAKRGKSGPSRESVQRMLSGESVPYVFPIIAEALDELEGEQSQRSPARPASSSQMFDCLREYFDMSPIRAQEGSSYFQGIYEFFTHSEKRSPLNVRYYVKGAIKLALLDDGVTLAVTERQSSAIEDDIRNGRGKTDDGSPMLYDEEMWEGYYLNRKNTLVIVSRSNDDNIPKFYVMARLHPNDPRKAVSAWLGTMVKVGENGGAFTTKVFMRRNLRAFEECRVLRNPERHIIDYLK